MEKEINQAVNDGYTVFISGMARGVDIWAAEILLDLRDKGMPVRLNCASPYEGFEKSWCGDWQNRYNTIMEKADLVHFICKGYSRACFQIQNEWMVDHSNRVIAVFNGEHGGTANTIRYAQKKSVEVMVIEEIERRGTPQI